MAVDAGQGAEATASTPDAGIPGGQRRMLVMRDLQHRHLSPDSPRSRSGVGWFGGGGIDEGCDLMDCVDGEPAAASVFADHVGAGGVVDAEDLVVGHVAVDPLHVGPEVVSTLLDWLAIPRRSSVLICPAPGTVRSITYLGMVFPPVVGGGRFRPYEPAGART